MMGIAKIGLLELMIVRQYRTETATPNNTQLTPSRR